MKFDITILNDINFIKSHQNEEWFDIYNSAKEKIGKAPRSVCHNHTFLLHKVVHLLVFNSKKELLLQKRQMNKKIQPGKWDTSVGGHIATKETVELALEREAYEELGINIKKSQVHFLYDYIMKSEIEQEWVFTYMTVYDGPIKFQKEEIIETKFWKIQDIKKRIFDNMFTPNFIDELHRYLKIEK